jgi:DNA-binding transcriptional regulator YdaS (Cro superfamily)
MTQLEALQEAIRRAGGQKNLAGLIGCTQGRISQMVKEGKASVNACPEIERETGVTCAELRPDKFFTSNRKPSRRRLRRKTG